MMLYKEFEVTVNPYNPLLAYWRTLIVVTGKIFFYFVQFVTHRSHARLKSCDGIIAKK